MCNEFERGIPLAKLERELAQYSWRLQWDGGRIPNDSEPKASVKIRDSAPVMRLADDHLLGVVMPWAWLGPHKKPVFNFVSEGRDFAKSDRVLIPATGFYEYTAPKAPKVKLKDQHLFKLKGEEWFWIAGIVKEGCFTMLTMAPGADIEPYHDRQIVIMPPADGMDWLRLSRPQAEIFVPRALDVRTLRVDGKQVGVSEPTLL